MVNFVGLVITKIRIPCKYKKLLAFNGSHQIRSVNFAIQIGCLAPGYQKFINMQFFC